MSKKCPTCKKDYEAGVKAAYMLGVQEGEDRYIGTVEKMRVANHLLFNELQSLDKLRPLADGHLTVVVRVVDLEKIYKSLRKGGQIYMERKFRKMVKAQVGKYNTIAEEIAREQARTKSRYYREKAKKKEAQ